MQQAQTSPVREELAAGESQRPFRYWGVAGKSNASSPRGLSVQQYVRLSLPQVRLFAGRGSYRAKGGALRLYVHLLADEIQGRRLTTPQLAVELGVTDRCVQKWVRLLRELGLLERANRTGIVLRKSATDRTAA